MKSKRTCLICSAPTNFAHFGIDACRSCSDFYKRAVTAQRVYACRQSTWKCTINRGDSQNCRGCRFEKCKQLGMKLVDEKPSEVPEVVEPSTSYVEEPKAETLLERVEREYLASVERRKICEFTLRPTSLHRHVKVDYDAEDLLLCSWTYMIDCLKMYAGDYIQFASATFPEFAALSLDEQRLMLRNFAARLFAVENQCATYTKFGSHDGPYYMATLTTCHDSRNFQFFIEEECPHAYQEIVKCTNYYTEKAKMLFGPSLANAKFTDTELAALFALSIWQIDPNQLLPDHLVDLCDNMRRRLFESLQEYYQKGLNLDDYSVRLGNLVTFEHSIQECTNLLGEEVQAYHLTGMLNSDIPFLQIVMQISL